MVSDEVVFVSGDCGFDKSALYFLSHFFSVGRERNLSCAQHTRGARRCREISRRGSYPGFFSFPLAASFQLGCLSLLFRVRNGIVSIRGVNKLISPLSDLSR
jgi:hypothetical protein